MYSQDELNDIHNKLKQKLKKFVQYAKDRQFEQLTKIFTEDGVLMSAMGIVQGKDQIKKAYEDLAESTKYSDLEITSKNIYEFRGRIYEMGTNLIVMENEGKKTEMKGNYCTIWIKQDNEWLIDEDIIPPIS